MRTFDVRSLYQEGYQPHEIDPDEYLLVTSPCLYSVHTRYGSNENDDWDGRFNFNKEAVEHMVASGCVPRLRRVRTSWDGFGCGVFGNAKGPGGPWKGFFGTGGTDSPQQPPSRPGQASLEELVITSKMPCVGPDLFSFWNKSTDFGALRQLGLHFDFPIQALETLASMATSNKFYSLRELGLSLLQDDDDENTIACFDQSTSRFLRAVPQLEAITLKGRVGECTFEAAVRCHGKTMRKLHLEPRDDGREEFVSGYERVREIQKQRPRLEELYLPVRRHQGGPEEVAVYRALGQMPRLRRATLLLDSHPRLSVLGEWAPSEEPQAKIIRTALANVATDSSLALEIFHEVFPSNDGADSPVQQRLKVEPRLGFCITEYGFDGQYYGLVSWVARSWVCVRDKRRRRGDEMREREIRGSGLDLSSKERRWLQTVRQECRDVWHELWPPRAEHPNASDWVDNWISTPLWSGELEPDTSDEK